MALIQRPLDVLKPQRPIIMFKSHHNLTLTHSLYLTPCHTAILSSKRNDYNDHSHILCVNPWDFLMCIFMIFETAMHASKCPEIWKITMYFMHEVALLYKWLKTCTHCTEIRCDHLAKQVSCMGRVRSCHSCSIPANIFLIPIWNLWLSLSASIPFVHM